MVVDVDVAVPAAVPAVAAVGVPVGVRCNHGLVNGGPRLERTRS